MTAQKKILDLTGSQYLVQKVKSAISDVDSSLSTHIADTDIHVTTADKATWNTVTSKANDSDVVHKSGNETISGVKTFTDSMQFKSNVAEYGVTSGSIKFNLMDKNGVQLSKIDQGVFNNGISYITLQLYGKDSNNQTVTNLIKYQYASTFDYSYLLPTDNSVWLGSTGNRFGRIYGIQYYYGSNNVEFSTKFVTTDTNQIISGAKTFSDTLTIYNSDSSQNTKNLTISSSKIQVGDTSNNDAFGIRLNAGASYVAQVLAVKDTSGTQNLQLDVRTRDSSNNLISSMARLRLYTNGYSTFEPNVNTSISLGSPSNKWNKINGVEPSSLSFPDLDNGIDISSYITDLTGASNINKYTPPVNGWISIGLSGADFIEMYIAVNLMGGTFTKSSIGNNYSQAFMPVIANKEVKIALKGSSIGWAKFYPCLGNV